MIGSSRSLLLAFSFVGFSCSVLVDAGRVQCASDADCKARGGKFASTMCVDNYCEAADDWKCADHGDLVAQSGKTVTIDFSVFDAVKQTGVADADALLCGKLDLECALPMKTQKTDGDGKVHFDVPQLFDGYVQLSADGYDPTLVFLPPSTESISLGQFPFTTKVASDLLGSQLGKPLTPSLGRILTIVTGCDMQTAADVSLQGENLGSEAEVFYAVDGFPSFTALKTDSSGFAGFVNVAPGSVTLNAELDGGRVVARVALFVRPGYVSVRRIQPWTD